MVGSRDLAAVIDARLRHRLGTAVPLPVGQWSGQVHALTDTEPRSYLAEIATLTDARKDRIGEHAADHAPSWAVTALGPVPGHPLGRLGWPRRASSIGAWRELSGYDHPADPIGPEPVAAAPDQIWMFCADKGISARVASTAASGRRMFVASADGSLIADLAAHASLSARADAARNAVKPQARGAPAVLRGQLVPRSAPRSGDGGLATDQAAAHRDRG